MHRCRLGQACHAGVGQSHPNTTCVAIGVGSADKTHINKSGNTAGDARPRDERPVRKFCHPQRTTGERELSEDVKVRQRQTGLLYEIPLELAHQRRM